MINICPNCKGVISNDTKTCPKCGANLADFKKEEDLPEPIRIINREENDSPVSDNSAINDTAITADTVKTSSNAIPTTPTTVNVSQAPKAKKKSNPFNGVGIFCIIIGIVLIISGVLDKIPDSYISYYDSDFTEYVGGDAYNYIIEASIRSGFIAGRIIEKAICLVGGLMILITGLILTRIPISSSKNISKKD